MCIQLQLDVAKRRVGLDRSTSRAPEFSIKKRASFSATVQSLGVTWLSDCSLTSRRDAWDWICPRRGHPNSASRSVRASRSTVHLASRACRTWSGDSAMASAPLRRQDIEFPTNSKLGISVDEDLRVAMRRLASGRCEAWDPFLCVAARMSCCLPAVAPGGVAWRAPATLRT